LTEDYNLELQYRKPFLEIWEDEKNDRELGPLSERMGVRDRNTGELLMTEEEKDAVSKCFYTTHAKRFLVLTPSRLLSCILFLQGLKLYLFQWPAHAWRGYLFKEK
jgi:mRNA (guanine-N7-)-methyltransferase